MPAAVFSGAGGKDGLAAGTGRAPCRRDQPKIIAGRPPEETLAITPFDLPELARSLASLPGVGPATAAALSERGYATWGDGLFLFPLRYQDRRRPTPVAGLAPGGLAVLRGMVKRSRALGKGGKVWRMEIDDGSGVMPCVWFRFKKPWLESFAPGCEVFAVGEVGEDNKGRPQLAHPELYRAEEVGPDHPSLGRIMPVYPELGGVRSGNVRRFMAALMDQVAGRIPDPLAGILDPELYPLAAGEALQWAHRPPQQAGARDLDPENAPWRQALAVNELFFFELGLAIKRLQRTARPGRPLPAGGGLARRLVRSLPFTLTEGQKAACAAIKADLARPTPMGRLLLGDVGTGKTVVAAVAALFAAECGVQTAIMAPTEVLARQHARTLAAYLEPLGLEVILATGSQNGSQRRDARQAAAAGAAVVVGTHALISAGMEFKDLGLVIIDEQHRFGVHQRLSLAQKGPRPHLLVLSATPIPRTLALALAGHLEISDLPQRPAGRPPASTELVPFDQRRQAVQALAGALKRGEQSYVICPLVEPSQVVEAQDAEATHRRLSEYFPDAAVGLLHGRLDAEAQQRALSDFAAGRTRILVATTVVEVGVDVPAATVMVVLGAERFGLSQLHQLRGRVGRGERPGRCLLVPGPEPGELALERLGVLAATSDGGEVAQADLLIRGPGQALGQAQSGLPPFMAASWNLHSHLLEPIRAAIAGILGRDPRLAEPGPAALKDECLRRWGRRLGLVEAG